MGLEQPLLSSPLRAHSSAGERPLHTREVPGSIPGAPILARMDTRNPHGCVSHSCPDVPEMPSRAYPGAYLGSRLPNHLVTRRRWIVLAVGAALAAAALGVVIPV